MIMRISIHREASSVVVRPAHTTSLGEVWNGWRHQREINIRERNTLTGGEPAGRVGSAGLARASVPSLEGSMNPQTF